MTRLDLASRPRVEELGSEEIFSIQAQISETETQIETLDRQMNELKRVYNREAQVSQLQKQAKLHEIESLRNILSPIGRLAVEILAGIFEDVCLSEDGFDNKAENDVMRSVFMISGVCTRWRNILRDTPEAWSKLHLSCYRHGRLIHGKSAEWVTEWLGRTKGYYPLDIELEFSLSSRNQRIDTLVECIVDFRYQIRSLQLRGSDSGSYVPFFQLPSSSFPVLEKLTLLFGDTVSSPLMDFKSQAFLGASHLRDLEIVEYWPNVSVLGLVEIPMEQLTSLNIALCTTPRYGLHVFVDMLRRCKNLTRLSYDIPFPLNPNFANLSIVMPVLKSLIIPCRNARFVSLLACLTMPFLEDLTLRLQDVDYHDLYMDIVDLQNRSTTALSSLTLSHIWGGETFTIKMIAILSILPELTSFTIDGCYADLNPLVRAITYSQRSEACPSTKADAVWIFAS
ncbi:hypothetical protein BT96DRAFT_1011301 [Gymnopus androsaceus JB14]|uniref:F-box domain-containing protein n=1 Tax=Gymnopus androsaceus JB14 TaxID=1447944 RepID=A0A6A4ILZ1_9AGAR|nr:hypothetical protein BT96DRAFT_1011301 [Gymnopus androsaceus JB14]